MDRRTRTAVLADEPAATDGDDHAYVSYLPVGTVLAVMPWNLPIWQVVRAAGPIMLSGSGFLLKHAPNVMGCAFALQEAYEASGFPKGLFANLTAGNDAVAKSVGDPRVAAITLTGSARAGAAVAATADKSPKKSLLKLGGTDAFIVLADADPDGAVKAAIKARFGNAGQVCLAAKRLILEKPIAEAFTQRFVEAARMLKVGDPLDPSTDVGPIARGDLRDTVRDQGERSIRDGARLVLGGHKVDGSGSFYEATVLADVRPGMTCFDEEVFGPVTSIIVAEESGELVFLAGGAEADVAAAKDILDVLGRKTVRIGEVGDGAVAKLIVNGVMALGGAALAEGLAYGARAQLDRVILIDLLSDLILVSKHHKRKLGMARSGDYPAQFPTQLMSKDMGLLLADARERGASLPTMAAAAQLYAYADHDHAKEDYASVISSMEDAARA